MCLATFKRVAVVARWTKLASNSSLLSPTQTTGIMPPLRILRTLRLMAPSSSLKMVRRSE